MSTRLPAPAFEGKICTMDELAERAAAKKARNFAEADRIRDQLKAEGITIIDTPQGAKWKRD